MHERQQEDLWWTVGSRRLRVTYSADVLVVPCDDGAVLSKEQGDVVLDGDKYNYFMQQQQQQPQDQDQEQLCPLDGFETQPFLKDHNHENAARVRETGTCSFSV